MKFIDEVMHYGTIVKDYNAVSEGCEYIRWLLIKYADRLYSLAMNNGSVNDFVEVGYAN